MPPLRRPFGPHDRLTIVILSVAAAVLISVIGVYVTVRVVDAALVPKETTDLRDYDRTLKEWAPSGLVSHFPTRIPPHARRVRFSAHPGFLQGGAHVQLRVELPSDEVRQIEARLLQATTRAYARGDIFDHHNDDPATHVPAARFRTADNASGTLAFPAHYTLYVLQAKNRGGSWNHGETAGTAVSTTANEVVFWAESW